MSDLTTIFHPLQRQLFPALVAELGALSALDQQFCEVISLTELGRFTRRYEWCGNGAPPCPRIWLAHAFIAKHVYQFPTTRDRKSTRLNSSHLGISYAVFCLKKKTPRRQTPQHTPLPSAPTAARRQHAHL